jgi:hypothetical protein
MRYKRILFSVTHQVTSLLFFLLLASATAAAQNNQVSVAAVGNFNPVTYIYINQVIPTMGSSQKSSVGGGIEYDHWFTPYQAFGLMYEQNPSDGKLKGAANGKWYIWPQTRYEFLGMFTQQININRLTYGQEGTGKVNRLTPFVQEGAGSVVTHENDKGDNAGAGWSHSLAFAVGIGSDYWVNNKFAVRFGTIILADQTGCYDDPTCRPTWGLTHDLKAGFSWNW